MPARAAVRLLVVATLVCLAGAAGVRTAGAETAVEAARSLIARYDEDPARIDRARALLEADVAREPSAAATILLSRVDFLVGEVRARTPDEKLDAYGRGRDVGKRAIALAPRDPQAHLWYAINTGRWAQTKGVLRSLFLLPTMREEIDTLLTLDPRLPAVHALAGNVAFETPGIAGGDRQLAEKHFRTGLDLDPHYTVIRVDLARLLITAGRYAEARTELERVLAETAPTNLADWTVRDRPRARALLDSIRGRK